MQISQGGDVLLVKDAVFGEEHSQIVNDLLIHKIHMTL